ncbi:MAG: PDZ domain-containing protein [Chloroflexota bacterium]
MNALFRAAWMVVSSTPVFLVSLMFWAVVIIVGYLYSRIAANERKLYGVTFNRTRLQLPGATLQGLVGGLLASLLMVLVGVTVSPQDLTYIWILSLLLAAVQTRLICFSYSAGFVSIASILLGWPRVSVPGLLALVAVLHITESLLIAISGWQTASPTTVENRRRETVGGFLLQRFWPVPFFALVVSAAGPAGGGGVSMPAWWPLIPPAGFAAAELTTTITPVVAALGYGDLAVTLPPQAKSRASARNLAIYSVTLLALAVLSSHYPAFGLLAAIFSPVGHELVVIIGSRREVTDPPLLAQTEHGLTVLAVVPGSIAAAAGLRSGDIIAAVNDTPVLRAGDIAEAMLPRWPGMEFRVLREGEEVILRATPWEGAPLGIVPVPEPDKPEESQLVVKRQTALAALVEKLLYKSGMRR